MKNKPPKIAYKTKFGKMYRGLAEEVLSSPQLKKYEGKVQLIFTSPPFPLNRKKKYGNIKGDPYINWLANFSLLFRKFLKKNGSIVIEMGNAWDPGEPVMSTLALRSLIEFHDRGNLNLCQQFVVYNPARLPSPAQWVTIERIRVKDAFTHFWWMSPSTNPKANNRRVLTAYSESMKRLLASKKYNSGKRPSEHTIGATSFLKNNKGAISSNVLIASNTNSSDLYQKYCRKKGIVAHPARMQMKVADFFVKFLTNKNDTVLDPFAGSNTTGAAAEYLGRKWISIEPLRTYIQGSKGRFL